MIFEIKEIHKLLRAIRLLLRSNPEYNNMVNNKPIIGINELENGNFKIESICWLKDGKLLSLNGESIIFGKLGEIGETIYKYPNFEELIKIVESKNYPLL